MRCVEENLAPYTKSESATKRTLPKDPIICTCFEVQYKLLEEELPSFLGRHGGYYKSCLTKYHIP